MCVVEISEIDCVQLIVVWNVAYSWNQIHVRPARSFHVELSLFAWENSRSIEPSLLLIKIFIRQLDQKKFFPSLTCSHGFANNIWPKASPEFPNSIDKQGEDSQLLLTPFRVTSISQDNSVFKLKNGMHCMKIFLSLQSYLKPLTSCFECKIYSFSDRWFIFSEIDLHLTQLRLRWRLIKKMKNSFLMHIFYAAKLKVWVKS